MHFLSLVVLLSLPFPSDFALFSLSANGVDCDTEFQYVQLKEKKLQAAMSSGKKQHAVIGQPKYELAQPEQVRQSIVEQPKLQVPIVQEQPIQQQKQHQQQQLKLQVPVIEQEQQIEQKQVAPVGCPAIEYTSKLSCSENACAVHFLNLSPNQPLDCQPQSPRTLTQFALLRSEQRELTRNSFCPAVFD